MIRRHSRPAPAILAAILVSSLGAARPGLAQARVAAAVAAPSAIATVPALGSPRWPSAVPPALPRSGSGVGQHIAQGLVIGALVGVVAGGVAGYHAGTCDQKSDPSFCHALTVTGGALLGLAGGAAVGAVGGYIYHVATRRGSGA